MKRMRLSLLFIGTLLAPSPADASAQRLGLSIAGYGGYSVVSGNGVRDPGVPDGAVVYDDNWVASAGGAPSFGGQVQLHLPWGFRALVGYHQSRFVEERADSALIYEVYNLPVEAFEGTVESFELQPP
jgi:hypothetical protein